MPLTPITIDHLTQAKVSGTGVFDVLMEANKVHLDAEFKANRIKGPEYSQVYLGSLVAILNTSVQFLLTKDKTALEAQLLEKQIELAVIEVQKSTAQLAQISAQTGLINQQTANALAEHAIILANADKIAAEVAHINAQTAVAIQQELNLEDDLLTAAKQREKLTQDILNSAAQVLHTEAQTALVAQQALNLEDELLTAAKQRNKIDQDILVSGAQKLQIEGQTLLVAQQKANLVDELLTTAKQRLKLDQEILNLSAEEDLKVAQTALVVQQQVNLEDELLTAIKQRLKMDQDIATATAQAALVTQQKLNLIDDLLTSAEQRSKITQEVLNLTAQKAHVEAQTGLIAQQELNMEDELLTAAKQRNKLDQEILNLGSQKLHVEAQTSMVTEQKESEALRNFVHPTDPTLSGTVEQERRVALAQKCKLEAEFDVLMLTKDKTTNETALLAQKTATERAQTIATGVDDNSVIGKQKLLYSAQTKGFKRDAEQKYGSMVMDAWKVRKTVDGDGASANEINKLYDPTIGSVVTLLQAGIAEM